MNFVLEGVQKTPAKEMRECDWPNSLPKDLVSEKFLQRIHCCCGRMTRRAILNPTARVRESPERSRTT